MLYTNKANGKYQQPVLYIGQGRGLPEIMNLQQNLYNAKLATNEPWLNIPDACFIL